MKLDDSTSRDSAVDTRVELLLLSEKTNCAWRLECLARKRDVVKVEFSDESLGKGLPVFKQCSSSYRFVRHTARPERARGVANNHGEVCYRQTNSRL